jgi:hypothetical protein
MLLTAVSGNATEEATEAELRDYDGTWTAKLRGQHGVISMGDGSHSDEDKEGQGGAQGRPAGSLPCCSIVRHTGDHTPTAAAGPVFPL